MHGEKGMPKIYISAESRELFIELVRPYIHPHFKYKISPRPHDFVITSMPGVSVSVYDKNGNE